MGNKSKKREINPNGYISNNIRKQIPVIDLFITIAILSIGIYGALSDAGDYFFWKTMRNAIQVDGTLTKLQIETYYGRYGSINEHLIAEYIYKVGGQPYSGSRPLIHSSTDYAGTNETLYLNLKNSYDKNLPIDVYVNPDNHNMSCLDLTFRSKKLFFESIFIIVLIAIGVFRLITYWRILKINKRIDKNMQL